jgi:PAS domain S-box-containing protein
MNLIVHKDSRKFFETIKANRYSVMAGLILLVGLYTISLENYLFFHTLVELFSIVIAFTIFTLTWNARRLIKNGYLLFLGISFLFVGSFDLVHTLAYKGMGIIPGAMDGDPNSANLATQLWLAARYFQSLSLIAASFFSVRRFLPRYVFGIYTVLTTLLLMSIFTWRVFPAAFIDGVGLTPFKRYSEYIIIVLFGIGLWLVMGERQRMEPGVLTLLVISIVFNIAAELAFTEYIAVYDIVNMLGHFFKVIAFLLIYKAVIETAFLKPQELLYRDLAQSEQALRASEGLARARTDQLEAIMDAVPAVVWLAHDAGANMVTGNRVASEFLRMTGDDNQSLSAPRGEAPTHFRVYDKHGRLLGPEELPLQIAATSGKPVRDFEELVEFDDGKRYHLFGNVTPLLNEAGQPAGAVAAFIDITQRALIEQALQESEQRYRSLFDSMSEGLSIHEIIFDPPGHAVDYRIVEANPAFETITQLPRQQVIGKTMREIFPDVDTEWITQNAYVAVTGEPLRLEGLDQRTNKYFETLLYRIGENRVAALTVDASERWRSQEALRQSEARLRRLVDANIIGIMYTGLDGRITVANDAFLDMVGYTRQELEAGKVNWIAMTPPEYHDVDERAIQEARERGACTPYEKVYLRKDGVPVPILLGFAYFAEDEAPFVCFVLDLTPQKRAEAVVKEYASQLEHSNRELQNFAFVASHDLQEPLRKIQAFGERLNVNLRDKLDEQSRDYLERMLNASVRMRTMINDLLSLSRVTTQGRPFERVDLSRLVGEVLSDLEMRIERSGGQVEVDDLPVIDADPTQMQQLFQNLIGNALKFHKPGVPPRVKVYKQFAPDARQVIIFVEDNGVGFEEQYAERIFQPFQRLHGMGEYEGSGMGLAICRRIVERHSGTIIAKSTPGEGATFQISLPAKQPNPGD